MLKTIRTFSYLFGYLPFTIRRLGKIKKLNPQLDSNVRDLYVDEVPKVWATGIMKRTKSTIEITGTEHLPAGPVLLISNHEGNFDIPVLISTIPKPFGFISKVEVKKFPIVNDWMVEMNCVFIDRSDRRSAMNVLKDSTEKLREGHSIIIFPEGTRSKGTGVQEFKSGFAKIAQDAGVTVVPIAIHGTSDIMEKNNNRIRPAYVQVEVLPAIDAETVLDMNRKQLVDHAEAVIRQAVEAMQAKV
ncbi:lysophospholipid acyltransferase family protein [Sporosarcina sp. YIM B06819]|uniref:lysophospholipid acyltransferase family protein n=1 Tax=Sporosarcina sp. YIM B06819 TaxID=3081769 RepID=UPI00298C8F66|nr:lysophospholipid acyltransferase family protein [Sporosarcina sp. YIM B06819]